MISAKKPRSSNLLGQAPRPTAFIPVRVPSDSIGISATSGSDAMGQLGRIMDQIEGEFGRFYKSLACCKVTTGDQRNTAGIC
jgi:hypothetical protein